MNRLRAVFAVLSLALSACAASAGPDEAATESALSAAPTGTFNLVERPSSSSYIKSLTIHPDQTIEVDYVRVRIVTPFPLNPFFTTREEEAFSLRGRALMFDSDGPHLSLEVGEPFGHLTFSLRRSGNSLELQAIGGESFVLKSGQPHVVPTDKRTLTCKGRMFDASITLDQDQRRRGTMKITRTAAADAGDPPNTSFTVAFTGNTGVDDFMGYEGTDAARNTYDFALSASELERTSGPISTVGVGFEREFTSFSVHHTLDCTIAR